jgi:hypothetical protein
MSDVCGVAPLREDAFVVSSGNAGVSALDPRGRIAKAPLSDAERWVWDNHLRRL